MNNALGKHVRTSCDEECPLFFLVEFRGDGLFIQKKLPESAEVVGRRGRRYVDALHRVVIKHSKVTQPSEVWVDTGSAVDDSIQTVRLTRTVCLIWSSWAGLSSLG